MAAALGSPQASGERLQTQLVEEDSGSRGQSTSVPFLILSRTLDRNCEVYRVNETSFLKGNSFGVEITSFEKTVF